MTQRVQKLFLATVELARSSYMGTRSPEMETVHRLVMATDWKAAKAKIVAVYEVDVPYSHGVRVNSVEISEVIE